MQAIEALVSRQTGSCYIRNPHSDTATQRQSDFGVDKTSRRFQRTRIQELVGGGMSIVVRVHDIKSSPVDVPGTLSSRVGSAKPSPTADNDDNDDNGPIKRRIRAGLGLAQPRQTERSRGQGILGPRCYRHLIHNIERGP